jgi:hypothetical protein
MLFLMQPYVILVAESRYATTDTHPACSLIRSGMYAYIALQRRHCAIILKLTTSHAIL